MVEIIQVGSNTISVAIWLLVVVLLGPIVTIVLGILGAIITAYNRS